MLKKILYAFFDALILKYNRISIFNSPDLIELFFPTLAISFIFYLIEFYFTFKFNLILLNFIIF